MFKPSKEKSQQTLSKINAIFLEKISEANKYSVAYAYYMKSGLFSKTIYSYVVGFSEKDKEIIVIPINSDAEVIGDSLVFNKSNLVSAKIGLQGDTIIKANGLDKELRFMVPGFTPPALEAAYVLPVEQIEVATAFRNFIKKGL